AKQAANRRELQAIRFDLVVVEEAHKLKNPATLNHRLLHGFDKRLLLLLTAHPFQNELKDEHNLISLLRPDTFGNFRASRRPFLPLTATPFQNDLKELVNLVCLLRPGQLGTFRAFRRRFMKDKRETKNTAELRSLLQEVMIRNRRGPRIQLPPRRVATLPLLPSPAAQAFYDAVTDFVRKEDRRQQQAAVKPQTLLPLQRDACS